MRLAPRYGHGCVVVVVVVVFVIVVVAVVSKQCTPLMVSIIVL